MRLPLALVTGLALGVVIWLHTRDVLARTGPARSSTADVPRGRGAARTRAGRGGLIVAARTGASLGAELASMHVSEQIDALELLGVSPVRGWSARGCWRACWPCRCCTFSSRRPPRERVRRGTGDRFDHVLKYQTAALHELYLADVIPAGLKTLAFGLVVGVAGCFIGMNAREGSEGVGRAATDSGRELLAAGPGGRRVLVGLIKADW